MKNGYHGGVQEISSFLHFSTTTAAPKNVDDGANGENAANDPADPNI